MPPPSSQHRIWFFAGGDFRKGAPNLFTGSFIRLMSETYGDNFGVIEGIYHRYPVLNVVWALGNAQYPLKNPERVPRLASSFNQIISHEQGRHAETYIVSSSYGSVVAAQTACYLAREIKRNGILKRPFHLALGASMLSRYSDLFGRILEYQQEGIIGKLIFDELHDEGDNSNGIGGTRRAGAFLNGLGICFPFLTRKYTGPSFLNTDSHKGHFHRRRAQSLEKAEDYLHIMKQLITP